MRVHCNNTGIQFDARMNDGWIIKCPACGPVEIYAVPECDAEHHIVEETVTTEKGA